jgi:ABC-2 type transport system permease protein
MTAGTTVRIQQPPEAPPRPPARLVVGTAARLVRRGALVVSAVSGVLTAFVAAEYRSTFSGAVSAASLEVLAQNPAIRTLFGPPVALDDPGGFTVWRTGTVVAVLVGVWGALAATRVTRGEEEAGRWDLLLAGCLRLSALVRLQRRCPVPPRRWVCCSAGPAPPAPSCSGR